MEKRNRYEMEDIPKYFNGPSFGRTYTFDIPYPNDIYHYTPVIRITLPPIQLLNNPAPQNNQHSIHNDP